MISSTFRDVRTKSRLRLSDLCHMRYVRKSLEKYSSGSMRGAACVACLQIEAPSFRPSPALNGDKKRGRFSCLSRNDHRTLLRLLLSDSYHLRTICCIPTRTAAMHCVSAGVQCTRTQPKSTVVFRKPGFRPVTPGDPWLCGPASRQVCLFVQPILGRKSFYTGSNLNWCRLNLIITQGRCVRSRKPGSPELSPWLRLALQTFAGVARLPALSIQPPERISDPSLSARGSYDVLHSLPTADPSPIHPAHRAGGGRSPRDGPRDGRIDIRTPGGRTLVAAAAELHRRGSAADHTSAPSVDSDYPP